jgi:hypothetical protein
VKGVRFRHPPNKVAVGGKAVNKDDAPPPKVKPKQIREYVPKHPATITASGKRKGRPPKSKVAGGELTVKDTENNTDNDTSGTDNETNELVMNLGSL